MMVKSKRNESRNGVISLSFYRPKTAVVNCSCDGNGALGPTAKLCAMLRSYFTVR
jgi:hypothetical protein